jgi:GNAT superfamily N-acetyltransferase
MTTTLRLLAIRVASDGEVQCMGAIRNTGSDGYSGDHRQVTPAEQRAWWREVKDRTYAWLYHVNGTVVGYGMLQLRDTGDWSPSAGILPEHRGRGYGGFIVTDLAEKARGRGLLLMAQARLDNPAAVKTHRSEWWDDVGTDDTYAYFRSKP